MRREPAAERALARATCRRRGSRKRNTTSASQQWRNQVDASRQALAEGDLGRSMRTGTLDPNIPQRQTSLIVDPPNGLLPALTAEGKRRALAMRSGWTLPGENHTYDGPQDFDSWDRCITRGMPSSMMPYRYNGGFRIVQAPGYVVFQLEMIHEARVIPTDGRAPLARRDRAVPRRVARSVGRDHARRRDDELQGRPAADQPRRRRLAAGQSLSVQRRDEDDGAHRPAERRLVALRDHDRGSRRAHASVHGALPDAQRRRRTSCRSTRATRTTRSFRTTSGRTVTSARIRRRYRTSPSKCRARSPRRSRDAGSAGRESSRSTSISSSSSIKTLGQRGRRHADRHDARRDRPAAAAVRIEDRALRFELPNWQPWSFAGELTDDGTIVGVLSSEQGGVPVTFRRRR